ncbi:hypothetical protein MUP00_02880 [Candidatus Bathyarchaeota archaeon]|nr:hypothetical protein [Candidatus Bathyarchaeota archaeon]
MAILAIDIKAHVAFHKVEEVMAKSKKSAKRKAADQRKAAKKKQSLSS